ncbi:MAG: hypothetical protein U1E52_18745 [Geminicoccaceae bacterium]
MDTDGGLERYRLAGTWPTEDAAPLAAALGDLRRAGNADARWSVGFFRDGPERPAYPEE